MFGNMLARYKRESIWVHTPIFRENLPILILVLAYIGAGFVTEVVFKLDGMMRLEWSHEYLNKYAVIFFTCFFGIQFAARLPRLKEGFMGLVGICKELQERYFTVERVLGFVLVYAAIAPFMSTFRSFKLAIPRMQPFMWDKAFMNLDRALHLGHHPWALLQPILGHRDITRVIDLLYVIWFLCLFAFLLWMTCSARRRLRAQFFISFALVLILLGTVLAILFSSAGPCYYGKVTGAKDPFAPLMVYLDSIHESRFLWAVRNQRGLWDAYVRGINMPFGGISAMPSVHVAVAVLFALVGWRVSPWFGLVLAGYALVIQVGAVHLGWHYAIDGYLSVLLTCLIWKVTDRGLTAFGWGEVADEHG